MSKVDIGNVVRVTLLSALRGLANVNTSALAIITDEAPIPGDFGVSRTYLNAEGVKQDFGSNSDTFALSEIIFSQQKNILSGKGYLVVIPRDQAAAAQPAVLEGVEVVNLTSLSETDYTINVDVDGSGAADIVIGTIDTTDLSTVLTSLNNAAVTSAGLVFSITGELAAAKITLKTIATGATKSIEIGIPASGTDLLSILGINGLAAGADTGLERVKDTVLRTQSSVDYFGIVLNEKQTDANLLELAQTIQGLDKLLFASSNLVADIIGVFKTILDSGFTHTRCLYYSDSEAKALDFAAGYASRGLSTDYDAPGSSQTMNLKEIIGLTGEGLAQSVIDSAKQNGVDVYADYGVPGLSTSGINQFFDQVYGRLALKVRLQIAGFNFLKQTNDKIPQTETGLTALKGTYRAVMALFVTNGTLGPGAWNSSTTFGKPEDHIRNIADYGYYLYSLPIAQQAQSEREARIAPVVQIAGKETGAFHSSDVTVLVEA